MEDRRRADRRRPAVVPAHAHAAGGRDGGRRGHDRAGGGTEDRGTAAGDRTRSAAAPTAAGSAPRGRAAPAPGSARQAPAGALRLNKYLAERGLCSRREADAWILAGRIEVNGAVATVGTLAGPADEVRVDGRAVGAPTRHVYLALHKPVGIECTTDTRVPHNVVDFVAHRERVFPIGRLDKDSEGLLLLTNDGDVVNRLLRAENRHEKEYVVTVDRPVTDEFVRGMASGVRILGQVTRPCRVERTAKNVFRIVLTQGLNRQIRRMAKEFGYTVRRLVRVRFVNVRLDGLPAGRWRDLTRVELDGLLGRDAGAADPTARR